MAEGLRIGIVGAGAVGSALAHALYRRYRIRAVISRSLASARMLSKKIHCKTFGKDFLLLSDCNWIFVTAPDSALPRVARHLCEVHFTSRDVHIVHTSGVHPAAILEPARKNKSSALHIAAMHPMQTFPKRTNRHHGTGNFAGIYFGVEGSSPSLKIMRRMAREIGAIPVRLRGDQKPLYHIGGVIASNFVAALLFAAVEVYARLGLSERQALDMLMPLIRTTLRNMQKTGIRNALTGPAARRDHQTIRVHRNALVPFDPQIKNLYNVLTGLCLSVAHSKAEKKQ
jgi:predicted short-subunit dehydrogenase-like oxidoreductase (DUF2520 family)